MLETDVASSNLAQHAASLLTPFASHATLSTLTPRWRARGCAVHPMTNHCCPGRRRSVDIRETAEDRTSALDPPPFLRYNRNMLSRRSILRAIPAFLAAPAIVRYSSLMPISMPIEFGDIREYWKGRIVVHQRWERIPLPYADLTEGLRDSFDALRLADIQNQFFALAT